MSELPSISFERLHKIIHYNRDTGKFYWKIQHGRIKWGDEAGCIDKSRGYVKINFEGKTYLAHRLAWFYVYGTWPLLIDHKDNVESHNWITNLREASHSQNGRNKDKTKSNTTGFKGVCKGKNGKFRVMISLGTYDIAEEAYEIYKEAALKLHGEFAHKSLKIIK